MSHFFNSLRRGFKLMMLDRALFRVHGELAFERECLEEAEERYRIDAFADGDLAGQIVAMRERIEELEEESIYVQSCIAGVKAAAGAE